MTHPPVSSVLHRRCHEQRRPRRRHAIALAVLAAHAALGWHGAVSADNTRWTVVQLNLGTSTSTRAYGINNAGLVVGEATQAQFTNPALWETSSNGLGVWGATQLPVLANTSGGSLRAINNSGLIVGQLVVPVPGGAPLAAHWRAENGGWTPEGLSIGEALAVNNHGHIAGLRYSDTSRQAVAWRGLPYSGASTSLGQLPGSPPTPVINGAVAAGINDRGQIVGYSDSALGVRAFVWNNGSMTDLGTLGGANSAAAAINNAGTVVGYADTAFGVLPGVPLSAPTVWRNGVATSLGGPEFSSGSAFAINNHELVVGRIDSAGGAQGRAFVHDGKALVYLEQARGVAGTGWRLRDARGVNDRGQIVGWGVNGAGQERAFLMTLTDTEWRAGSGAWDDAQQWSFNVAPGATAIRAHLTPSLDAVITGPSGLVSLDRVVVGGGGGRVDLTLAGGILQVSGLDLMGPGATLSGSGQVRGQIINMGGRIAATDLSTDTVQVAFNGLIEGPGRITALTVDNQSGTVRAPTGGRLWLDSALSNRDRIEIVGGELKTGFLLNGVEGSGRIMLREGVLRSGGLDNAGRVDISSGHSDVFGNVANRTAGRIVVSGQGSVTFWDGVVNEGEIRVSADAVASFFDDVMVAPGGLFTGTGLKYFEAGLSGSAAAPTEGDVGFGDAAELRLNLAGEGDFDRLSVLGKLSIAGTLVLGSTAGFVALPGQVFDLLDWGTAWGNFSAIDASGLVLAPGAALDVSRLYLDGTVTVVPEPGAVALWLAGLAVLRLRWQRQRGEAV